MENNVIKVKLWEHTVGYMFWDKVKECAVFEFEPIFLQSGLNISPLTMPIGAQRNVKQIPWFGNKDKLFQGLPPLIADSLPDKWGNSLFKSWLRSAGISLRNITPIDHLSFIGSRAMGALEYEPARELGDNSAFSVNVQQLYDFAKQVLEDRETTVLNGENSILWQDLIKISSSPGGKRPKAIVAIHPESGDIISGQGLIPEGFQHFILKYDDNSAYPYAKLEYIYYKMALDAGIQMMPSELRSYGHVSHFLTHRFDRIGNKRLHIQTLAAMSPLSDSYEDIFTVIRKLNLPYEDSQQQFLRIVFNVVARNVDDHSKNFSFCMDNQGNWRLSPAYDLTYSIDRDAPHYLNRHMLTINGKNELINRQDLEKIAISNEIKDYNQLISRVQDGINNFEKYATELDIPKQLTNSIQTDFIQL